MDRLQEGLSKSLEKQARGTAYDIWKKERLSDCDFFVNRKGLSALVNGGFSEGGSDAIIIGLERDYQQYIMLQNKGVFEGDFNRFVKFTVYHEIGHKSDTVRLELKRQRSAFRREMFNAKDLNHWEGLRKAVWDKTFEIELNAWNYAERFLESDEHDDFRSLRYHCIVLYYEDWLKQSEIHFCPFHIVINQKELAIAY